MEESVQITERSVRRTCEDMGGEFMSGTDQYECEIGDVTVRVHQTTGRPNMIHVQSDGMSRSVGRADRYQINRDRGGFVIEPSDKMERSGIRSEKSPRFGFRHGRFFADDPVGGGPRQPDLDEFE